MVCPAPAAEKYFRHWADCPAPGRVIAIQDDSLLSKDIKMEPINYIHQHLTFYLTKNLIHKHYHHEPSPKMMNWAFLSRLWRRLVPQRPPKAPRDRPRHPRPHFWQVWDRFWKVFGWFSMLLRRFVKDFRIVSASLSLSTFTLPPPPSARSANFCRCLCF